MSEEDSSSAACVAEVGIQAVVGLGNPGARYEKNRHNVGFWFVDRVAQAHACSFKYNKNLLGHIGKIEAQGSTVYLFKPDDFMNNSGRSVHALQRFFKMETHRLLIAHDEIDFPVARVRVKHGGGHGGHNGLRDVVRCLGSQFWRLRIGIGRPENKKMEVRDYVLSDADANQRDCIMAALDEVVPCIPRFVHGEFSLLMNQLHRTPDSDSAGR